MHILNVFLIFFLLFFCIRSKFGQELNNNAGEYYNTDNDYGANSYNGYWSSNGNGYGYGYYPETNCLYNYVPPYLISHFDPGFSRFLYNLSPMDMQTLFNTQYASDQSFLSQLQAQNPQLYNQLSSAYAGLDPNMQQNVKSLLASLFESVQKFANSLNDQGAQSTPMFNQNFPNLANFLRGPAMNAFSRQPNPFMTNGLSSASSVGQQPNYPPPNLNPFAQNRQNQPSGQILSNSPSMGGVGGLVDGILNTVSSAIGMGNGKR